TQRCPERRRSTPRGLMVTTPSLPDVPDRWAFGIGKCAPPHYQIERLPSKRAQQGRPELCHHEGTFEGEGDCWCTPSSRMIRRLRGVSLPRLPFQIRAASKCRIAPSAA